MCVFMLQQYEAQLCDLLTFSKTSSGAEDGWLKEEMHSDTQLLAGRARALGMLAVWTHTDTDDLSSVPQVFLTNLADLVLFLWFLKRTGLDLAKWRRTETLMSSSRLPR